MNSNTVPVGIMKISSRAIEHAALPVLLKGDLDDVSARMVKRRFVLLMRDGEGMVDAAMLVEHGVDRPVALHKDETRPGCIEEDHVPARHSEQMLAADNLLIEARAHRDVAHGDTEMGNGLAFSSDLA